MYGHRGRGLDGGHVGVDILAVQTGQAAAELPAVVALRHRERQGSGVVAAAAVVLPGIAAVGGELPLIGLHGGRGDRQGHCRADLGRLGLGMHGHRGRSLDGGGLGILHIAAGARHLAAVLPSMENLRHLEGEGIGIAAAAGVVLPCLAAVGGILPLIALHARGRHLQRHGRANLRGLAGRMARDDGIVRSRQRRTVRVDGIAVIVRQPAAVLPPDLHRCRCEGEGRRIIARAGVVLPCLPAIGGILPLIALDAYRLHGQRHFVARIDGLAPGMGQDCDAGDKQGGIGVNHRAVRAGQLAAVLPAVEGRRHGKGKGRLVIACAGVVGPGLAVPGPLPLIGFDTHGLHGEDGVLAHLHGLACRVRHNAHARVQEGGIGILHRAVLSCQLAAVLPAVEGRRHTEGEGRLVVARAGVIVPGFAILGPLPLIGLDAHGHHAQADGLARAHGLALGLGQDGHGVVYRRGVGGRHRAVVAGHTAAVLSAVKGIGHTEGQRVGIITGARIVVPCAAVLGPLPLVGFDAHSLDRQADRLAVGHHLGLGMRCDGNRQVYRSDIGILDAVVLAGQLAAILASAESRYHPKGHGAGIVSPRGVVLPRLAAVGGILPLIALHARGHNRHHDRAADFHHLGCRLSHNAEGRLVVVQRLQFVRREFRLFHRRLLLGALGQSDVRLIQPHIGARHLIAHARRVGLVGGQGNRLAGQAVQQFEAAPDRHGHQQGVFLGDVPLLALHHIGDGFPVQRAEQVFQRLIGVQRGLLRQQRQGFDKALGAQTVQLLFHLDVLHQRVQIHAVLGHSGHQGQQHGQGQHQGRQSFHHSLVLLWSVASAAVRRFTF